MVKVIGDGKEYEFKEVSIEMPVNAFITITGSGEYYNFKDRPTKKGSKLEEYKVFEQSSWEKPKQSFVSVPKEIQFLVFEECGKKLGLRVSNHLLSASHKSWQFIPIISEELTYEGCVLVPVKREELKAGEWALNVFAYDLDESKNRLYDYHLIIDKEISVHMERSIGLVSVFEVRFGTGIWFKVVPRSEVEKR